MLISSSFKIHAGFAERGNVRHKNFDFIDDRAQLTSRSGINYNTHALYAPMT